MGTSIAGFGGPSSFVGAGGGPGIPGASCPCTTDAPTLPDAPKPPSQPLGGPAQSPTQSPVQQSPVQQSPVQAPPAPPKASVEPAGGPKGGPAQVPTQSPVQLSPVQQSPKQEPTDSSTVTLSDQDAGLSATLTSSTGTVVKLWGDPHVQITEDGKTDTFDIGYGPGSVSLSDGSLVKWNTYADGQGGTLHALHVLSVDSNGTTHDRNISTNDGTNSDKLSTALNDTLLREFAHKLRDLRGAWTNPLKPIAEATAAEREQSAAADKKVTENVARIAAMSPEERANFERWAAAGFPALG